MARENRANDTCRQATTSKRTRKWLCCAFCHCLPSGPPRIPPYAPSSSYPVYARFIYVVFFVVAGRPGPCAFSLFRFLSAITLPSHPDGQRPIIVIAGCLIRLLLWATCSSSLCFSHSPTPTLRSSIREDPPRPLARGAVVVPAR